MLRKNWKAELHYITVVESSDQVAAQEARLSELVQLSRIRGKVEVTVGAFKDAVDDYPADLNIFGMQPVVDFDACRSLMWAGRASALFVKGSGTENALT